VAEGWKIPPPVRSLRTEQSQIENYFISLTSNLASCRSSFPGHHIEGGSRAENLRRPERDEVACRGSPEPASSVCNAYSAPVRGWVLPSAGGRRSHRMVRVAAEAADLKIEISGVRTSPLNPSMRWFQATHANWSASFRASAARSAECRTELP
jgi:hypothetical protein